MSDNPFQSPQSVPASPKAKGVLSGTRDDLRRVAQDQKTVLVCILIYFCGVGAQFAMPAEAIIVLALVMLIVVLTAAVFVFRLAMKVYGTGVGIVLGILCLVPLLGLIILLIVNGKATSVLKQNGIEVGLLGADVSSI